jgi:hypothetical protein
MFAVYAKEANFNNPLASVAVGERPEPVVPEGWVRVRVTHASLNRHDIFTLCGVTAQEQPIPFPMILGNDGAGLLDDGTPVVIYPLIGSDSWEVTRHSIRPGMCSANPFQVRCPTMSRFPSATRFHDLRDFPL